MKLRLAIGIAALGLAIGANAEPAPATAPSCATCTAKDSPTKTLPAAPPAANPLTQKSEGFWGEWKATQTSARYTALKTAVTPANLSTGIPGLPGVYLSDKPIEGGANKAPAPAPVTTQRIVDVAVTKPEDAAKLLGAASTASGDETSANALKTVVMMTTSQKVRAEAMSMVAPEARADADTMTANLSTGIQGLPGIYLSDQPIESPVRGEAPSGYTPVEGGSAGCPAR